MKMYVTTYQGRGSGVYISETRDQAINTAYETLKSSGTTPDRRLINAFPIKTKSPSQSSKPLYSLKYLKNQNHATKSTPQNQSSQTILLL